MNEADCDIAIVGGGLSGGLIALALARHRPDITLRLIESGHALGGNHRWSWFASDLSPAGEALMEGFRKAEWDHGYHVRFPKFHRRLRTPYRSLASSDFAARLERELPAGTVMTDREVYALDKAGLDLADGTRIAARAVIDCRGFTPGAALQGGWQVFMGRHLRTRAPHGLTSPIIMDADVEQRAPCGNGSSYRFVYILPLSPDELFIEDTYYADHPQLDRSALAARIDEYQRQMGWQGEAIGHETGVLPVITGGSLRASQQQNRVEGVAMAGARGGFVHPLTSYTLPIAVEVALSVAEEADMPGEQLSAKLEAAARRHWAATEYYRFLGRMLFGAAKPQERYKVFERFYGLREPLIERFYVGKSTFYEKARVLAGKPPVPVLRAVKALLSHSPPLENSPHKDQP